MLQHALKWFAVLTTVGMLFVLIGGALVTKTDSGMGCGDSWPLCNGEFVPSDITPALLIELSHRLVSGSVGMMVLILSIWSWKKIGHVRETKFLSILAFSFLLLQALIGAAAVLWGQSSTILALHFGISLISFASVLLLTLLIFEVDKKFEAHKLVLDSNMKFHIYGITIYSYFVVYSGALVRHIHASLACPDWPVCTNGVNYGFPTDTLEWVQMGHRFLASIIFFWVLIATIKAIKHHSKQRVIYWGFIIAFILVSLQVITGALIIFSKVNLYISLTHALFISCLFGILSYLVLLSSRSKQNAYNNHKSKDIFTEKI